MDLFSRSSHDGPDIEIIDELKKFDPNYTYELNWTDLKEDHYKFELKITAVLLNGGKTIVHTYKDKSRNGLKSKAIEKWKEESDVKAKEEIRKPKKEDGHRRHDEVTERQTADGVSMRDGRNGNEGSTRKRRLGEEEKDEERDGKERDRHKRVKEDRTGRRREKLAAADTDTNVADPDTRATGEEAGKRPKREHHHDNREESDAFIDDADPRTPRYKDFISA